MWLLDLIPLILQGFASMIKDWLLWLVVIIVAVQYRKTVNMREEFWGIKGDGVIQMTASALVYGIIGGLIGSIALITVGISINQIGIAYLWPLAILLMLINMRFLCFSYAGGIISLSYLLFGYPEVEVPQLMALIGLLHLIEAILIYTNGYQDAVPVYTRNANGKVVGGYIMQKFWPIPVVLLVILSGQIADFTNMGIDRTSMPGWWPLLKSSLKTPLDQMLYAPLAVTAALGYGDIAVTSLPKEKTRISAFFLLVYSLILLALAVISSHIPVLAWVAALFGPLGHELVIKLGKDPEIHGKPIFQKEAHGLRAFEVNPASPAYNAGLRRGDLILNVNGIPVNSKQEFAVAVAEMPWMVEVDYISYRGTKIKREYVKKSIQEGFGVIFPPEPWEKPNVEIGTPKLFKKFLQKIFSR